MAKWKKVKLGDVCSIQQSTTELPEKVWLLNLDAIERGSRDVSFFYEIDKKDIPSSTIQFDDEMVLYSKLRPYLNKVILPMKAGVATSEILPLRPKKDLIIRTYLAEFLRSPSFVKHISTKVSGAKMPRVIISEFLCSEIPLPAMEEQKKIAARLDAVSDLLAKQKQLLAEQDTLIQSLFYDMFGEHQLSQQKEQWNKISDVAVVAGGSTPKTQTSEYWDGDLNWFTPAELENCSWYVYSSQRKITKAGVKSCHLEEFPINTVLLSSRAPIGKLAIAREAFYCNQGFKNIICGETVNPIYLYHLLMYNINYMKSLGKGATFKEISKKIVEDIKIPIPPLELQEKFAAIVEQIESEKSKIKSAIAETQTLFNALMAEYFEE